MTQQEVCHGKKASPSPSKPAGDALTASAHVPSVWQSDADGPSQSPYGEHLSRSHTFDAQSLSVPQQGVPALPPGNATGGRRPMGPAARRIWLGCDRASGDTALSPATQHPADPPRAATTRAASRSADGDRSTVSL